jgi:choline dehydrogenase-like flavoprotein
MVHTDIEILREGIKLARRIGETAPLASSLTEETWPGSDVQTDDEWDEWIRPEVFTEYHPSSTCAMLPLEQGGVVDANLRVYGLANVRVADASVPPIALSAHLMSSTYGIAEQASSMIRAFYNAQAETHAHNSTKNATSTAHHSTATSTSSSTQAAKATATNGSNSLNAIGSQPWILVLGLAALFFSSMPLL